VIRRLLPHALLLIPLALAGWIVGGVVAVPQPEPLVVTGDKALGWSSVEQRKVFAEIARHEAAWRGYARRHFPRHAWSAEDDYHWNVHAHIERSLAKRYKAPSSRIWGVYDRGVRGRWQVKSATPGRATLVREYGPLSPTTLPLKPRTK